MVHTFYLLISYTTYQVRVVDTHLNVNLPKEEKHTTHNKKLNVKIPL